MTLSILSTVGLEITHDQSFKPLFMLVNVISSKFKLLSLIFEEVVDHIFE
jgi:BarA-like signal transduction histidine kinase